MAAETKEECGACGVIWDFPKPGQWYFSQSLGGPRQHDDTPWPEEAGKRVVFEVGPISVPLEAKQVHDAWTEALNENVPNGDHRALVLAAVEQSLTKGE